MQTAGTSQRAARLHACATNPSSAGTGEEVGLPGPTTLLQSAAEHTAARPGCVLETTAALQGDPVAGRGLTEVYTVTPPPSEPEVVCAEAATLHHDTSALLLAQEAPHKSDEWVLGDDWLQATSVTPTEVRHFSAEDFSHAVLPRTDPAVAARMAEADQALNFLRALKRGELPEEVTRDPDAFVQSVLDGCNDPEQFQAGGWTLYAVVWEHVFGDRKRSKLNVKSMLTSIRHGIRWQLVPPASQTSMPDHAKKMARVQAMLSQQLPADEVAAALHSAEPRAAHFANHRSVAQYTDFVREEIAGLLRKGAAIKLPKGQRPLIVNPLGVADNKAPKLRLVLDAAYPNVLLKYEQLRYEQLADMPHYLRPEDWATTTDEKSGYYHQALHPSMWTLLGFEFEGGYYVFTHMPFGIGPACRAYTVVKQELYGLVRDLSGARLTFLIDDVCSVAGSRTHAAFQGAAIMLLQRALNFTFSLQKCTPFPTKTPRFLGMVIDIAGQCFVLPEDKVADFRALVAALSEGEDTTNRTLMCLAGKLVSYSLAIGLAPLYAQQLFKVMRGDVGWDTLYDTPAEAVQAMQWIAERIDAWNGHVWEVKREVLVVAGDYSSQRGYGAHTPHGELQHPIVVSLTPEELAAIQANELSSTVGEAKCVLHVLQTLLEHHSELLVGRTLHYQGDGQGCMSVMGGMRGGRAVFPIVRAVWELAKEYDVHLSFEWFSRDTPNQQIADMWSKVVDNSQWALNAEVFDTYIAREPLVLQQGGITVDLFADHLTAKAARFYSRHLCPGTLGVNAMRFPWAHDPRTGSRELGYANGDFSRMGEILHKIKQERADCVVVYPDWPRYWQVMWAQLPVRKVITLPRRPDLCIPGPRVDARKVRGRPPKYPVKVAFVIWG